jgi:hypothetical protein
MANTWPEPGRTGSDSGNTRFAHRSVRGTKEAFEKGEKACATEIKELRRKMEKIKESAMSDPPCRLIRGQMLF